MLRRIPSLSRLPFSMFVVLALSSSAIAQTTLADKPFNSPLQQLTAPNPETYGTTSETAIAIPSFEFTPIISTVTFSQSTGRYSTSGGALDAGVHLPAGASITRVEAQACNTNAASSGTLALNEISNSGVYTNLALVTISANTGCMLFPVTLTPTHTVSNGNSYFLDWNNFFVFDGTIRIVAARVFYKLQVSPPPSVATFNDVPLTHPFNKFVEALYAAGITAGCGSGNFCPDAPVTRGQMAVFLAAALGLHWAP